jgi:hypothetical protein
VAKRTKTESPLSPLGTYLEVSGPRKEFVWDEAKGHEVLTGVEFPDRVRLQTLRLSEAEEFVSRVYKRENILCAIHEVTRAAKAA